MATEKRLIDSNKAQAVLMNMAEHLMEAGNPEMAGAVVYAAEVIGKQRTVDAVEVVHGRWVNERNGFMYYDAVCSVCGGHNNSASNYCPNCGAKMDGEEA